MAEVIDSFEGNNNGLEVNNIVYGNISSTQLLVMSIFGKLDPDKLSDIMSNARENN